MSATHVTPLEPGNRVQLPAEWTERLGLNGQVVLEQTPDGILIRSARRITWDEFFATKLTIRPAADDNEPEITEISGDDLLF